MTFWVSGWLRAFALTLLVEIPVAAALLAPAERSVARRVAIVVVANLATHPLVWFLFPGVAAGETLRLALAESWAIVAELAIYWLFCPSLRLRRAALVSLAANGASLVAGLAFSGHLGFTAR